MANLNAFAILEMSILVSLVRAHGFFWPKPPPVPTAAPAAPTTPPATPPATPATQAPTAPPATSPPATIPPSVPASPKVDTPTYILMPWGSYYPQKCVCNCDITPEETQPQGPRCDWYMVFKAVKGSGRDVFDDWTAQGNMNVHILEAMDVTSPMPYRNGDILDNWNTHFIQRVKVEIYSNGNRMTWFYFDGTASDITSWMSPDRLILSPYTEMKDGTLDIFSTAGEPPDQRSFVINRLSPDCNRKCGYLMVIDPKTPHACDFENAAQEPFFLYSSVNKCSVWSDRSQYGIGDRFVISVKACDIELTDSENTVWEDPVPFQPAQ